MTRTRHERKIRLSRSTSEDDGEDMPVSPKRYREVYADDFINQDSHDAPLSTLPVQVAKLLLQIFSEDPFTFKIDLEDSFDICHEISREEMREAVERLKGVSAAKEAPAILASFSEDIPNVTIFEVCSRVGHGELLRDLQSAAQARLRHLIFEGTATMQQVFRLLRAGADPTRQNLSCFVNLQGEAKRPRIEMGPEKGARGAWLSGTPLHWVCWATGRVPSQRQQHYLEICRWLCDIAPLALFLKNDNQQTPLELLMAQSPSPGGASGGELRCSRCGQSGHVEKECLRAPAEPSKMLVAALARGLSKAMQQYPLLSASCLVDGGGLRKAVGTARELLLQGDDAVDGCAVEALDALLLQSPQAELPSSSQLSAAQSLGGLAVARARQKAIASIKSVAEAETEQADNASLRRQLAALQETRQRERQELEASVEALEAQLSEAQRRAEEAEVQVACLAPQPQHVEQERQHASARTSSKTAGVLDHASDVSSEAAFISHLRRRRLIASGPELPEHVREGVQQLSDSLCAAVERLASDLYESECHFLYEIIQNAEDAHARDRPKESAEPRLSLRLGPPSVAFPHGYFISENNEAGFTERDVTALCDISASSKKKPLPGVSGGSIGCKGIGFKSVFTVSDRAHVLSKGFTFVFDVAGPLGKLGYVTPTWLSSTDIAALPPEVAAAHAAGRTVLFLPLRAPGLASAIGQEMDELSAQGRASLLFLRRLCCIELLRQVNNPPRLLRRTGEILADESRKTRCVSVVIEQQGEDASKHEHRYLVYCHKIVVESSTAELVLAFPVTAENDEAGRCEPLFCSLPIRQVGFGFALHCDCFDLVANRSDLHRGSVANRAVRDVLPEAFAGACRSSSEISQCALQLLGEPVADPFWRVAREGILERLSEVSCVQTSTGDLRKPGEVLLRGSGPLRRATELLPAELVLASCGRSLCDASDSSEERLLRKLGAEDFAAKHLGQCLAFRGGSWPQGWVASVWDSGSAEGLRRVASLYNLLGIIVRPGEEEANEAVDLLLQLPSLPLFPLLRDKDDRSEVVCACLEEGPIYLGLCPALSEQWQLVLGAQGALRLLPPAMKTSLDSSGLQLLKTLGIEPPSRVQLAEAALQRQLEMVACEAAAQPVAYCCWAALAILRDLWAERVGDAVEPQGIMAVCHALKNLGTCSTLEAAEALVKRKGDEGGLGALLLAPADGELRPPPALRCPSLLGHSRELPSDLVERIEGFLGASSMAVGPPQKLQTWPLADCQDAQQRRLEALLWEAFFVDGLGAQPRRPADWRQERVPADLTFSLGQELGSDGARSLWVSLLDEKAVPEAVFRYATRRLLHPADRAWLSELPARAKLRVRELFLHSVYWPVVGAALNGLYLDLPQLGAADGRGFQLQQCLRGLGARAQLDIEGLAAALEALLRGMCRLPAHFARIYSHIDTLETTAEPGQAKHPEEVEWFLRRSIFDPALTEPVKASACVWELPKNELLAQCCNLTVLRDIYTPFGDVQLKRYFEARGVPSVPNTAESYLQMCHTLMDAAEELGRAWRRAEGNPEMALVSPGRPGASRIGAVDFLNQVWDALIFIYKGMSSLEGHQRDALRPFSPVHTLLVPLPCPQGGPPQVSSMLEVARFYDGALFRRISICESFWEVAPDLADSPAAAWAFSLAFPAELKPLFVDCFGVREVVDTAALREGILARVNHGKRAGGMSRPGGFGSFGGGSELGSKAVNELGLPDELLRALGGDGRATGSSEGDALAAAEEALASLRRRSGGGGRSSGEEDDHLVAPALPARSVRCPAAPERRLKRAANARGRRGERVAVYNVQRPEMRGLQLARGYDASQRELDELASVLQGLVSVFRLDSDCVAIVNGDVVTAQDDKGECHHGARRHWPLLFSAGLRPPAESSFWFGEFCHALAHRSTGPSHGAHHSRVMQILMAQYFDAFAQHFSQAQLGQQVPTRTRRRRSTSSSSRRSRRRRRHKR